MRASCVPRADHAGLPAWAAMPGLAQLGRGGRAAALREGLAWLWVALLAVCVHAPHESIGPAQSASEWEEWAAPEPYRRPREGAVVFEHHGCERMRCSGVGCQDGVMIDACWTEGIVGCAELAQESVTCEYLSRCGPDMWYPSPCVEEEVERWVAGVAPGPPPVVADNSCTFRRANGQTVLMGHDGSCDEPNYCRVGTDCEDCGTCSAAGARPLANASVWVARPADASPPSRCGSQDMELPPIQARCRKTEHRCNVCATCNAGLYPSADRKACLPNITNTEDEVQETAIERRLVTWTVVGTLGLLAFIVVQPIIWKILGILWKYLLLCKARSMAVIRQKVFHESPPVTSSAKVQPATLTHTKTNATHLEVAVVLTSEAESRTKRKALALAYGHAKRNRNQPLTERELLDAAEAVRAETVRKGGSPAAAKAAYEACLARLKEQKRMEAVERNERARQRLERSSPRLPKLQPLPQLRSGALPSMILSPGHFGESPGAATFDGLSP